jgi:hypothetical protein
MKKIVWIGLILWSAGIGLDAAHASRPQGATASPGGKEIRVCLELMDLEGEESDEDGSMELPPLKSEKKGRPQDGPAPGPKTTSGKEGTGSYAGKGDQPDSRGSVGLTPVLLGPPGSEEDLEKLPMKPLAGTQDDERAETGVSTGDLPGGLKSPEPADIPGQGLRIPSSAGSGTVRPVDAPEIPLLSGQGSESSTWEEGDAPRGAPVLKPAKVASPGRTGKPAGGVVAADVPEAMDPFGGSELDDKLIAIYEKYYKNRR